MRPFEQRSDSVLVRVRVTPNASKEGISGLWVGPNDESRLVVRVTAPPDKGRANKAVLKLLAKALALPKSAISLTGGDKDRAKTFVVAGAPGDIVARLEAILAGIDRGEET